MSRSLTIKKPFDMHLHVRDDSALASNLSDSSKRFAGAIIMPNLNPPVTTSAAADEYMDRIKNACEAPSFRTLMTLYLTDNTSVSQVTEAAANPNIFAFKLYPAGATTNSAHGVTDLKNCEKAIQAMSDANIPLLVHGEVTDPSTDIFDREKVFIETVLVPLRNKYPNLKICFEHITTSDAAEYVANSSGPTAATITAHHLLANRNAIFKGGINPHHFCLPVLKREEHRLALLKAATSNCGKFFLGTDSAPHIKSAKEASCGCAGIYTSHAAIELYAEAFDEAGAIDNLENFASVFGPAFYEIETSNETITLTEESWQVPETLTYANDILVPFRSGETVSWKI